MKKKTIVDVNVPFDIATGQLTKTAGRGNPAMSQLSVQYRTLSDDAKTRWDKAHRQTFAPLDNDPPPAPHGNSWTAFYTCNAALTGAAMPTVLTPGAVNVPVNLPPLKADIVLGVHLPSITLTPTNSTPYPAGPQIAVWATAAVPQGRGATNPAKPFGSTIPYRFLGTVTGGIPLAGLDVTDLYLGVFSSVPASCKIGFKLMAINPGGWHSEVAYTFGLTPLLSLSASAQGDPDIHLAASGE